MQFCYCGTCAGLELNVVLYLDFEGSEETSACLSVVHAFLCHRNALNRMMIVYVMVACAVKLLSLFAGWLLIRCWLMP